MVPELPPLRLLLYRHAEAAWLEGVRPWLEATRGRLTRSSVVVPTRGQAYGLKMRCVAEGVPLLGVEFLTPGLARKKWIPLHLAEQGDAARPAIGRELLLLGLRLLIEDRLAGLAPENPLWGFWKSLQSDPERALDDFDELLKAGFRARDFPLSPLASVFSELADWVERLGYDLAPLQTERAALALLKPGAPRIGGRLLVYGLSAELWGEFGNVAALARRFSEVTVLLPEPEFRGAKAPDEGWIQLWEALLGVPAETLDVAASPASCDAVADLWASPGHHEAVSEPQPSGGRVLVGRTRREEMALVAREIEGMLEAGASHIGVIFPSPDAAHARLCELLDEAGTPYVTTLESVGSSNLETQLQRALLRFYQNGARWEDLFELWPLLKQVGHVSLSLGKVRGIGERLFDEAQSHALAAYESRLGSDPRADWREVSKIVQRLLPAFPSRLTLGAAIDRITALCESFDVPMPSSFAALRRVAEREPRELPSVPVLEAVASFVPEGTRVPAAPGKFARVTLLTRRRAEGLSFSHLIFAEANAGVWPRREESSPWLSDEDRAELNQRARFTLGLFTAEDRARLEKRSYAALARDTRHEVVFTASLFDEADPENRLAPNSWVERVLWSDPALRGADCGLEELFGQLVVREAPKEPADAGTPLQGWKEVWRRRRDPSQPFDDHFFSADPAEVRPDSVAARVLERAVQDPVELWFSAVLGASRVEWRPLARARKKALGQWVHRVLARSLQGSRSGTWGAKLPEADARAALEEELRRTRALWPENRYWESFYLELARGARDLLRSAYQLSSGDFVATELPLAPGAKVPVGKGEHIQVTGRVDLVWADRPEWDGADVQIVDFKTGADAALSAERMASRGFGLQLGIYLAAAQSLGARSGRVWMLKPSLDGFSSIEMVQAATALTLLNGIGQHLRTGVYGALTPDRSDYGPPGFTWPLACVPIPFEVLEAKHRATFPTEGWEEGA